MSPIYETIAHVAQEASVATTSGAVLTIVLLTSLGIAAHRLFFHALRRVPGPFLAKVTPLYFAIAALKFDRVYRLRKLHEKYGPIVRVGPNEISLSDWRMYRRIYTDKQHLKDPQFYLPFSFLGHGNVFSVTDVADHSARRTLQARVYAQREVAAHAPNILDITDMLIDRLLKSAAESPTQTADAYDLFGAWGVEIICKVLVNAEIPDDPSQTIHFLEALESSPPTFFANIFMPWLQTFRFRTRIPGLLGRAYSAFAEWEALTTGMLKDFQNKDRRHDDKGKFGVTPLLEAKNKQLGRNYTFREALEEAMGIVLAGSGVSGHTFIYLTYALARPEGRRVQKRLREELEGASDSLAELTALPYLNAVIKETYRVFPAIMSTLPRILGQALEVTDTGVTLPPGTIVGMQNYIHHRDPSIFPKPDEFIPERWLENHEMSRGISLEDANAALTPYSVGSRNCMGQTLAKTELYLAVPRLVRRLDFSLSSKMKEDDMHMKDVWAVLPKGRRLFLDLKPLEA
ncbi:cytochrome P450 [Dactylonectria estremocensis]|uniref:Cytochrome P450 n=1 Tax=Dactylonectria estremocensis TaxID=1079267 RepID=A0A9P9JBF7_9HYPO|nr:cytochrome P450 [Dactylonectria estremocensis]